MVRTLGGAAGVQAGAAYYPSASLHCVALPEASHRHLTWGAAAASLPVLLPPGLVLLLSNPLSTPSSLTVGLRNQPGPGLY